MVAIATLAPLPGFLAAGNAYAYHGPNFVRIEPPAKFAYAIMGLPYFYDQSVVNVSNEYRCSDVNGDTRGSLTVTVAQPSGSGFGTNKANILCNNKKHEVSVSVVVIPAVNLGTGSLNLGKTDVTSVLQNAVGGTVDQDTRTIRTEE